MSGHMPVCEASRCTAVASVDFGRYIRACGVYGFVRYLCYHHARGLRREGKLEKAGGEVSGHTPPGVEIVPGYIVTREGEVWSTESNWRGYGVRSLRRDVNSHGYLRVRLTVNGRRRVYLVHKLVALAFLPPCPSPAHEVRHLDGNRQNNVAENIAWGTRKDNADDRERHGRTSRGERHAAAIRAGLVGRTA